MPPSSSGGGNESSAPVRDILVTINPRQLNAKPRCDIVKR